jgi:hypothetical protein
MEFMEQWPLVAQVIAYVVAFNVLLAGVKGSLDVIKDKTVSTWDNKAAEIVGKVLEIIGKILDIAGYNKKH